MSYEIDEIKEIRKSQGITQSQLAKLSNVSQSLIAKIEAGRLDPTYSKAQMIFQALDSLTKKKEVKAADMMTKKLIFIEPNDSVKDAITKMEKYEISQMPVILHHKAVGFISDKILLQAIGKGEDLKIKEVMADSPPIISSNTTVSVISNLLKHFSMVLVSESGELIGVITRHDLLSKVYKG